MAQSDIPKMLSLIHENLDSFALDVSGLHLVVPATTGYQAATATLALLAGAAGVTAITRPSNRYHSAEEAAATTLALAALAGVDHRLQIDERIDHRTCRKTNILVNSDPISPITRSVIERLPKPAVIATMHEPWMLLEGEIDICACQEHGITVSAVNESHAAIGGTDYRAALCLELFQAAGIAIGGTAVALVCDNLLASSLERGMQAAGAHVAVFARPDMVFRHPWDVIVLAQKPTDQPSLTIHDLGHIADVAPRAAILQYWGDIDRKAARYFGLRVWPPRTPGKSQMGLPLEALGPAPVVRLIAGALKAAEVALTDYPAHAGGVAQTLSSCSNWR